MRIVIAAARKISSTGIHSNKGRRSAILREKKVSTQKKVNRVITRNAPRKIKATGEAKKPENSLRAMRVILLMALSMAGASRKFCTLADFAEYRFQVAPFALQCIKLATLVDQCLGYRRRGFIGALLGQFQRVTVLVAVVVERCNGLHSLYTLENGFGFFQRRIHRDQQTGTAAQLFHTCIQSYVTVANNDHAIADRLYFLQDVGGKDHGCLLGQRADQLAHMLDLGRIQTVGGLVQNQD